MARIPNRTKLIKEFENSIKNLKIDQSTSESANIMAQTAVLAIEELIRSNWDNWHDHPITSSTVEPKREGYYDYMLRRYREEENKNA